MQSIDYIEFLGNAFEEFHAWCDQCELERLRTDGWNDDSMEFAGIKLVCEDCYFEIKAFNSTK